MKKKIIALTLLIVLAFATITGCTMEGTLDDYWDDDKVASNPEENLDIIEAEGGDSAAAAAIVESSEPYSDVEEITIVDDVSGSGTSDLQSSDTQSYVGGPQGFNYWDVPEWSGNEDEAYTVINDNVPFFTEDEITTDSYEYYSDLDDLGRVGPAMACLDYSRMPTEDRGDISSIYPTGWVQNKYDSVNGGWIYNRCHEIAFELSGENANEKNLATGTRFLNLGMLPFENLVADYLRENQDLHVMYRVSPIFVDDNLLMNGFLMEAMSAEDHGGDVEFCIFVYNVQPHIGIDYATGDNWALDEAA